MTKINIPSKIVDARGRDINDLALLNFDFCASSATKISIFRFKR